MSSLTLVTAPPYRPVSEEEVWAHLRVPLLGSPAAPADRTHILALIDAAVGEIDGPDGTLGRALVRQTWDLKLDAFPSGRNTETGYRGSAAANDAIRVPLPPLAGVTSISYVDTAGATQTLAEVKYTIDADSTPGRIVPAYGEVWPATRDMVDAVTVRFVAGFAPGATQSPPAEEDYRANVPPAIKAAIKLMVERLYDVDPRKAETMERAIKALLPAQVWA
jgi:uncharacterized phiE125 gp8 family phage protein